MTQISEAERIVKLMLFIRENSPVDLAGIRRALPYEYGKSAGSDDSTRRRFERDKKTLQDSGVFLTVDNQQRYALDSAKTLAAPLVLTKPQVSLLRLLCGALLDDKDYPLKEELRMVLVKLGDELEIPDMLPQLVDGSGNTPSRIPQGFAKVKKAITTRKRLSFAYTNTTGTQSQRTVEPLGCFFLKGSCYVAAYDPNLDSERLFRLDRMGKLRVNGTNPKSPDFEERPFDAADFYGLPFQFGDDLFTARIRIDEPVLQAFSQLTMGVGAFEQDGDHIMWTVNCRNAHALAQWCIENGPGLHIEEPESARQIYIDGLRAYLSAAHKEVRHEG